MTRRRYAKCRLPLRVPIMRMYRQPAAMQYVVSFNTQAQDLFKYGTYDGKSYYQATCQKFIPLESQHLSKNFIGHQYSHAYWIVNKVEFICYNFEIKELYGVHNVKYGVDFIVEPYMVPCNYDSSTQFMFRCINNKDEAFTSELNLNPIHADRAHVYALRRGFYKKFVSYPKCQSRMMTTTSSIVGNNQKSIGDLIVDMKPKTWYPNELNYGPMLKGDEPTVDNKNQMLMRSMSFNVKINMYYTVSAKLPDGGRLVDLKSLVLVK